MVQSSPFYSETMALSGVVAGARAYFLWAPGPDSAILKIIFLNLFCKEFAKKPKEFWEPSFKRVEILRYLLSCDRLLWVWLLSRIGEHLFTSASSDCISILPIAAKTISSISPSEIGAPPEHIHHLVRFNLRKSTFARIVSFYHASTSAITTHIN